MPMSLVTASRQQPRAFGRALNDWCGHAWIIALSLALSTMGASVHAQGTTTAHPEAAKQKIAMCMGCHGIVGYQASFPEVYRVPKLSGQNEGYISAALVAYRKGERKHPTMRSVAQSLSDQDIADIAAYFASNAKPRLASTNPPAAEPSAQVQALLTKGNCSACHGAGLNHPIAPNFPKLAGQHPDYVYVALKSYQTEGNPQVGRGNAVMAAQAKLFTHDELKTLAKYVGSLPGDLQTVPEPEFK